MLTTFFFINPINAYAQVSDIIKVAYGSGPGQLGASKIEGPIIIKNPQAITFDGVASIYLADNINKKIMKININEKKVSDLFNFSNSLVSKTTILDIAASHDSIYIMTLKELVKFSIDGKKCDLIAKIGDKEKIKQPRFLFLDKAMSLALIDEYYENPQLVLFSKDYKINKIISLKFKQEAVTSYASNAASKFYANTITPSGFNVFEVENEGKPIFYYQKDPAQKLDICYVHFIGFDSAENNYCHVAFSEKEGPVKENCIIKFDKNGKFIKKAQMPLPVEDEIVLSKPMLIAKEDLVLTYSEAEDGFVIKGVELK